MIVGVLNSSMVVLLVLSIIGVPGYTAVRRPLGAVALSIIGSIHSELLNSLKESLTNLKLPLAVDRCLACMFACTPTVYQPQLLLVCRMNLRSQSSVGFIPYMV